MKNVFVVIAALFVLTSIPLLPANAAFSEPRYELGINDWGVPGALLPPESAMLDTDQDKLRSALKNTEPYTAETTLQQTKGGGGCWGCSVTSILSAYSLIDYTLYPHENGTVPCGLTDIGYPYLSDTGSHEDITLPPAAASMILYYHTLQCADVLRQECAWLRYTTTPQERAEILLDKLHSGKPVLVAMTAGSISEGMGAHAVVAYDVESGDYIDAHFDRYDKKILIYDPAFPQKCRDGSPTWYDQCDSLYLNSETGAWCLQWFGWSTHGDGEIVALIDDINLLNTYGLLEGTEQYDSDKPFLGVMTSNWINQEHKLQTITLQCGTVSVTGDATYLETSAFYPDNNANAALNYLTEDTASGYRMALAQPQELETVMFYENSIGKAWSERAQETDVMPDGYAAVKGETAPYLLEYCCNEGHYTGAWYQVTAQGSAAEASLQMVENGCLLKADSMYRVCIRTRSHESGDQVIAFSTDADAALLTENAAHTVTASADLDGDGTFETELPDLYDTLGDLDDNGRVNSSDAALLLIAAAQIGAGQMPELDDLHSQMADVNGDGLINASDAAMILIYAAKVGAGGYADTLLAFMGA